MKNKVYIASDHAGFSLKEEILKNNKETFEDLGTDSNKRAEDILKLIRSRQQK